MSQEKREIYDMVPWLWPLGYLMAGLLVGYYLLFGEDEKDRKYPEADDEYDAHTWLPEKDGCPPIKDQYPSVRPEELN